MTLYIGLYVATSLIILFVANWPILCYNIKIYVIIIINIVCKTKILMLSMFCDSKLIRNSVVLYPIVFYLDVNVMYSVILARNEIGLCVLNVCSIPRSMYACI